MECWLGGGTVWLGIGFVCIQSFHLTSTATIHNVSSAVIIFTNLRVFHILFLVLQQFVVGMREAERVCLVDSIT